MQINATLYDGVSSLVLKYTLDGAAAGGAQECTTAEHGVQQVDEQSLYSLHSKHVRCECDHAGHYSLQNRAG